MCTVLLPPGVNPVAGNKYIIPYHIISWWYTHCTTLIIIIIIIIIIFSCSAAQRGLWPPCTTRFLDHTQPRATVGRTPLDEGSARRRDLYLTTDKHAPGGIRTHDRNRRTAVDLRLRQRGRWDRHTTHIIPPKVVKLKTNDERIFGK
jgi:hypothetical protein